nr:GGDEF and EAL domain-containing protein [uncultured Blautia sp.]
MIDISNLDSRIFDALSQTSDNMYIYIADLERDFSRWSKPSVDYFNLPGEFIEDTAKEWVQHIHPQDQHIFLEDIGRIFEGKSNRHNCEYRALNKYGKYVWVRCQGIVERKEDGGLGLFVGTMMNLGVNAKFDQPTGLYTFYELKKQLPVFINQGMEGAILLFDVDRLQRINDILGYRVGDEVLQRLGQKCRELAGATFYRGPGGKFYCIVAEKFQKTVKWIYQQVQRFSMEVPKELNLEIQLTISCGVAYFPQDAGDFETLHANVEYALEQAKKSGRGSIAQFSGQMHRKTVEQFRLQEVLRESVANNCRGFALVYQPLINGKTQDVYGAETLMRFYLPDGTMVSPLEFIPILEEDGTIRQVGEWLLVEALAQAALWREKNPEFVISVNVSYIQILQEGFREMVTRIVEQSNMPAKQLILELTESCKVSDPNGLQDDFEYFKNMGINMALDDFGTEYSSIALLRKLKPQWIKIDHTFVRSIQDDEMDQAILEYIMNLSKQTSIKVCVEGVENAEILSVVQTYAPELLQGYYYSKPCPAEEFTRKYFAGNNKKSSDVCQEK